MQHSDNPPQTRRERKKNQSQKRQQNGKYSTKHIRIQLVRQTNVSKHIEGR